MGDNASQNGYITTGVTENTESTNTGSSTYSGISENSNTTPPENSDNTMRIDLSGVLQNLKNPQEKKDVIAVVTKLGKIEKNTAVPDANDNLIVLVNKDKTSEALKQQKK